MLAYQVCECTRSAPSQAAASDRSTPRVVRAAFAPASSARSGWPVVPSSSRGLTERVHPHVEVTSLAQGPHQLGDVDPRSAVDGRWVLLGQDVDSHEIHPSDVPGVPARQGPH